MRQISSSMLERIKSAQQTLYGNADPRVEIVIQRNNRYIEEGTELQPNTIRTRNPAGSLDLAMRREDSLKAPDLMYMVWIDADGIAKVSTQPYVATVDEKNNWAYQYSLGPAEDVASEFDGYWVRTSEEAEVCFDDPANWTHITTGEPWFFRVLSDGSLVAQQGENGSTVTLASSGVTTVSAVRSWKPVPMPEQDSGLIVAYIRGGVAYYRAYAEQENGSMAWESERSIPTAPEPAQNVSVFRTNDFRTGFAVESNGEVWAVFSERNWAGMSVPPEVFVQLTRVENFNMAISQITTDKYLYNETFNNTTQIPVIFVSAGGDSSEPLTMDALYAEVIDGNSFYIDYPFDVVVLPEYIETAFNGYTVTDYTISGTRITLTTTEEIEELGFTVSFNGYPIRGVKPNGHTRRATAEDIDVQGTLPEQIETFNFDTEIQSMNIQISTIKIITKNQEETFTISTEINSFNVLISRVGTDPV